MGIGFYSFTSKSLAGSMASLLAISVARLETTRVRDVNVTANRHELNTKYPRDCSNFNTLNNFYILCCEFQFDIWSVFKMFIGVFTKYWYGFEPMLLNLERSSHLWRHYPVIFFVNWLNCYMCSVIFLFDCAELCIEMRVNGCAWLENYSLSPLLCPWTFIGVQLCYCWSLPEECL